MKFTRTLGATAIIATAIASFAAGDAFADSRRGSDSLQTVGEYIDAHGTATLKASNSDLTSADIASLANDDSAHVGAFGKILYVDAIAPVGAVASSIATNVTSIPLTDFLSLNSRPGSSRTIYLDFDGHTVPTGTVWDYARPAGFGGNPLVAGDYPAFTMDGSAAFSNTEKQVIINAWAAVAEDYSIFDVNVTTQFPGEDAITRSSVSDTVFGTRALITGGNGSFNSDTCDCGGIAYTGVFNEAIDTEAGLDYGFDHSQWQPAFAFIAQSQVSSGTAAQTGKFVSDVVSHEVGHNLSLFHDGSFQDSNRDGLFVDNNDDGVDDVTGDEWTEYFLGSNDGKNWAPIMGAGYYNGVVQWSNGDYGTAANPASNREDDISNIVGTGLSLLPDEANNSTGTSPTLSTVARDGIIGSRTDIDWFKVVVTDGKLGVYSYAPTSDTNLDTRLTLLDWSGLAIFSADAPSTTTDNTSPVAGMDGVLNATLPNGTYYIRIEGMGRAGSYSDYGSIGQYSIKTRAVTVLAIPSAPYPYITGKVRKGQTLTANRGTWTAGTSLSQQWLRNGSPIAGATGKTYVLKSADVGKRISVRVLGQLAGKRQVLRMSSRTVAVTN